MHFIFFMSSFFKVIHWDYQLIRTLRSTCRISSKWPHLPHCKDTIPKIRNKCSQKRSCAATVPIPTFIFLWAIHIFPWSVCQYCCRKIDGPNVGIYRSLTKTWKWKFATEDAQFLFWKYINPNFFAMHGTKWYWCNKMPAFAGDVYCMSRLPCKVG